MYLRHFNAETSSVGANRSLSIEKHKLFAISYLNESLLASTSIYVPFIISGFLKTFTILAIFLSQHIPSHYRNNSTIPSFHHSVLLQPFDSTGLCDPSNSAADTSAFGFALIFRYRNHMANPINAIPATGPTTAPVIHASPSSLLSSCRVLVVGDDTADDEDVAPLIPVPVTIGLDVAAVGPAVARGSSQYTVYKLQS
ncbi:hypothetical protein CC78DRAFT_586244 [Lojkania enalia]|uniref:Uncharacterized protein n=1 Tax=Lojkania enalia TaxID=147567 RepID=A0A9P4N1Y0_9PLEO|nr:hypothetical protein CC78DRAFT_586244 [Didymosphaeria enalia]